MLVSIIMPTYNCGDYIEESIHSVLNQSMTDWELLIVDDKSTDQTAEILKPYTESDPRIHYECLEKNSGAALARTRGLMRARGKYVAFIDSDDLWDADKLKKQISFMRKTGAKMSATGYRRMDSDGNDLHISLIPPRKTDYKKCIRLGDPIGNLTVMYDREALGDFTVPDIKKRNDFALWLQVLKKTRYCYGMSQVLATYRMGRENSISQNKLCLIKYHWQLYHDIEHHNVIRSIYEIACWAFVKVTRIGYTQKKTD